jgi:hypothetical protein
MNKKLPACFTESVLWLKRLMIITGIYFYSTHFIKGIVDTKLTLFELYGIRYALTSESIIGNEIKAKYDAQMAAK